MSNISVVTEHPDSIHREDSSSHTGSTQYYSASHFDIPEGGISARLTNPLNGIPQAQLEEQATDFARLWGLPEELILKGALVAQNPLQFESFSQLTEAEKMELRQEQDNQCDQPRILYCLIILCSLTAAIQTMDRGVTNGANLFWPSQLGLDPYDPENSRDQWLLGLVDNAPFLIDTVLGSWLNNLMNQLFGRRGTIAIAASLTWPVYVWQGRTKSWPKLLASRLVIGLGISPQWETAQLYAAECAPAPIRSALVRYWQTCRGFGLLLGFSANLAFYHIKDTPNLQGRNWHLMVDSSPRWLANKGRYLEAFESLCRLRKTELIAARDLYYMYRLLEEETKLVASGAAEETPESSTKPRMLELLAVPRNRRAAFAALIVTSMQQLCGTNLVEGYSSFILYQTSNLDHFSYLVLSWGFGVVYLLSTLLAMYTIDGFRRRLSLLATYPGMAACMLLIAMAHFTRNESVWLSLAVTGMCVFGMFYSPCSGSMPLTYSSEVFPLYMRACGLSFVIAVSSFLRFMLSLVTPLMLGKFTVSGTFGWYAAWNCIGWVLVLLFVPETKNFSLEELDMVFSQSTPVHATYQLREVPI